MGLWLPRSRVLMVRSGHSCLQGYILSGSMTRDFGELDKEAASGALAAKKPRAEAGEERTYLRAECVRSRGVESVRRPRSLEALLEVLEDRGGMHDEVCVVEGGKT